jgi:4-hydroxyphenylpyruvate dioxygenase
MADGGMTARVENGKLVGNLWDNPMGTDGFEFVEYTAPDGAALEALFVQLGFTKVATHRSKKVSLFRQGDINFIVNGEPESLAQQFARDHGPSACAMAFRVKDAGFAYDRALELGAKPVKGAIGPMELNIPAIEGIGGSLIYLVDRYQSPASIYDIDFVPVDGADQNPVGCGLTLVDHLTHNVHRGRMDHWFDFYNKLFNFQQIRYFDIEGKLTGLKSRALTAPCGKIRIPINESAGVEGRVDQIEEYLREYKGEGIQHIALATNDIIKTYDALKAKGISFMTPPPATYYDMLEERLPGHGQPTEELRQRGILLDGAPGGGLLLQIFTATVIGPIFFEIIQRKGDDGFGEGNFRALFESIERDQLERGVLKAD